MHRNIKNAALALALFALPASVAAQEAEVEACTTTLEAVTAGQVVEVTATFPHAFGEVVSVEGGVPLATEEQIAMIELASEEAEEAVEMASDPNVSTFWLNTTDITPGTYALILHNEAHETCEAQVEVVEPGS